MAAMRAEKAARQILRACQNGDAEVIVANPTNVGVAFQSLFPGLTGPVLTLADRILPEMGGIGQRGVRGYDSESAWSPSLLTTLSDKAARKNNEMRSHPVKNA